MWGCRSWTMRFMKNLNGIIRLLIPVMPEKMTSSADPVDIPFTIEVVRGSIVIHESGKYFDRAVMKVELISISTTNDRILTSSAVCKSFPLASNGPVDRKLQKGTSEDIGCRLFRVSLIVA